jgi:dTDP-4-dehydrorhamnose reductase
MKIFLTGASGLVGSAVALAASRRGHDVAGVVGAFPDQLPGLGSQRALDLTKSEAVKRCVLEYFPDVIMNCAAISEPSACDADPERSEAMNVTLPTRLAELALHLGARILHISSEQVFDGNRSLPYADNDPVSPINLYGRQKVESERSVLASAPHRAAIVRAPLLMGNSPSGRRALHERLFGEWSAGKTPRLYTDEFRQPCTAENLADVLVELAERPDVNGVFQWAGTELLSRFDLGLSIRAHFKLSETSAPLASASRSDNATVAAQRPACLPLDITPLGGRLKAQPQSIAEQLQSLRVPAPYREWYFAQDNANPPQP